MHAHKHVHIPTLCTKDTTAAGEHQLISMIVVYYYTYVHKHNTVWRKILTV